MEHVRHIQEIVDENREQLPTGVVTSVMRECQSLYKALPKLCLWKISYVEMVAAAKHKIVEEHKTLIAEEERAPVQSNWLHVINTAKIPPRETHTDIWPINRIVLQPYRVIVITGIQPFLKRARRVVFDDDDTDDEQ
jgi:hypothetical protein